MLDNTVFIHSLADVQSNSIGSNTTIWQFTVVLNNAVIGSNCNLNCHVFVENDVIIGNNVTVKSGVFLWDGIRVEDNVFIGPNTTFVNNKMPRSKQFPDKHIGAYICENATLGANCTIMGDIKIGKFAMIGAGSVVTKDVPDYQIWYGNPAVFRGFVNEYYNLV